MLWARTCIWIYLLFTLPASWVENILLFSDKSISEIKQNSLMASWKQNTLYITLCKNLLLMLTWSGLCYNTTQSVVIGACYVLPHHTHTITLTAGWHHFTHSHSNLGCITLRTCICITATPSPSSVISTFFSAKLGSNTHPQNCNVWMHTLKYMFLLHLKRELRNEDSTKLQSSFQKPLCLRIQITIRYESAGHYSE